MHSHYIRPASRTYTPTRLGVLTVDTSATTARGRYGDTSVSMRRWRLEWTRRRVTRWTESKIASGVSAIDLWETVRRASSSGPRLYLVAEEGADSLTLGGWWNEIEAGRMRVRPHGTDKVKGQSTRPIPMVMSAACDIVGAEWDGGSVRCVAPKNHGADDWRSHAESLLDGVERVQWATALAGDVDHWPMVLRSMVLMRYYQRLMQAWTVHGCGPWADSLGACGWSMFRRHVKQRSVLQHDSEPAHDLECSAVYGGRCQTFFFGSVVSPGRPCRGAESMPRASSRQTIAGPLYHLDFRAQYCSIMATQALPQKLLGPITTDDASTLAAACSMVDVVLLCRVDSKRGHLPYRTGSRVVYPLGCFTTTLTTPEYVDAFEHGEIVDVITGYRYSRGYPLREFGRAALGMRDAAKAQGDIVGEVLAKAVGNALTGRLGRRRSMWKQDDSVIAPVSWGVWTHSPGAGVEPVVYRAIAGRSYRYEVTDRRIPGLTATYATILAYGRAASRRVLDAAGVGGCVSWDTDGGWFTRSGYESLKSAGLLDAVGAGCLRLVGACRRAVFRTPKHYWVDGKWTLGGIAAGFRVDRSGIVHYSDSHNPVRSGADPSSSRVVVVHHSSDWSSIPASSPVSSSGWASSVKVVSDRVSVVESSGSL